MQGPHPLQLCSLLSVVGKLEKGPFPLPRLPLPADPLRAGAASRAVLKELGQPGCSHTPSSLGSPTPSSSAQASFTPPACSSPSPSCYRAMPARSGLGLFSPHLTLASGATCTRAPARLVPFRRPTPHPAVSLVSPLRILKGAKNRRGQDPLVVVSPNPACGSRTSASPCLCPLRHVPFITNPVPLPAVSAPLRPHSRGGTSPRLLGGGTM